MKIPRNPKRRNDGKSLEILKDGMKGGQSDGKSPEILKDETITIKIKVLKNELINSSKKR